MRFVVLLALAFLNCRERLPTPTPFSVVKVKTDTGFVLYVTLLPSEVFSSAGLPPESIVGELKDGEAMTPSNFIRNAVFVASLNTVVAEAGPLDPELQQQAQRLKQGMLPLVDRRTTRDVPLSSEDVFGAFVVEHGVITSYQPNAAHRLLTAEGWFVLPASMEKALLSKLIDAAKKTRSNPG